MKITFYKGNYRLKAKEDVKRATTLAEIEVAMTIWNGFVTSIRVQLEA